MHETTFLRDVGLAVVAAAGFGFLAAQWRVPLMVAYLAAGVLLGDALGLGLITDHQSIETLSSIGLVLLMFILGLEIHIDKLLRAGRAVVIGGLLQVMGSVALVAGLLYVCHVGDDWLSAVYLGMAAALSSTLIVVKILSDRMEIDSLPARVTLGILVIQDIAAVLFLAFQPNLGKADLSLVLGSLARVTLLVFVAGLTARKILPRLLARSARFTEVLLLLSLSWCFAISGFARYLGLSAEMGALVAGVTLAAFPYHVDVAARISSLRDFFITLFFVSLGLQVPMPSLTILGQAGLIIALVWLSRAFTLIPGFLLLRYDLRIGILATVNLSQVSEFGLVIASFGVALGHVSQEVVSVVIFAMAGSMALSSFLIPHSHSIYQAVSRVLKLQRPGPASSRAHHGKPRWFMLGVYKDGSSLFEELKRNHAERLKTDLRVVDFNPVTLSHLKVSGFDAIFGDISHPDTLAQAGLRHAELVMCTLDDIQLKGTTNFALCRMVRRLAPDALLVVTASSIETAKQLYEQGADYVYLPRVVGAYYLADVIDRMTAGEASLIRERANEFLRNRSEIVG